VARSRLSSSKTKKTVLSRHPQSNKKIPNAAAV